MWVYTVIAPDQTGHLVSIGCFGSEVEAGLAAFPVQGEVVPEWVNLRSAYRSTTAPIQRFITDNQQMEFDRKCASW